MSHPPLNSVNPYLVVPDCVAALEFYAKAFGAEPGMRMPGPGGQGTMHADMKIGNSTVMMTDENPQFGMIGGKALGGSPVSLHLYVEDCNAAFEQAIAAGCTEVMAPADMFWGDRFAKVKDPYELQWSLATPREELTPEEMAERGRKAMEEMGGEPQ